MKYLLYFPFFLFSISINAQVSETPRVADKKKKQPQYDVIDICGCMCEPQFPGGNVAMYDFLKNNLDYPKEASQNRESGKVYVSFVIDGDGSVSNVQIARGVSSSLNKEAMRLIQNMPRWDAGYDKKTKRYVKLNVRIPINFILLL